MFCFFESLWNVHKTIFILILWRNPKLLGQKRQSLSLGQNLSLGQIFLAAQFFLFIDSLLKL